MTPWTCEATPLRALDGVLLAAAGAAFVLVSRTAGPAGPAAEDAFLAGRGLRWWEAGIALASSEVSALTLVAVPAAAFSGGWGYALFFAGSLAGRAGGAWLAPRLRSEGTVTIYGLAGRRLGPSFARMGALLFCAARALSSTLRLVAAALALAALTGLGSGWAALLLCAAAAAYTGYGGLRAVVRASLLQAAVYLVAAAALVFYTLNQIPGNLHGALEAASAAGRLTFADAGPWWQALATGAVGAFAGFGADFEFVQKLLACRSDADARRAVALATGLGAGTLALLLAAGTTLIGFYHAHPALAVPERLDRILPHFGATVLPAPLLGLLVAAVFFAAVDLPLSALSAVSWADLGPGEAQIPASARWSLAAAWSAALFAAAATMLGSQEPLSWAELAWPVASGPLLALSLAVCFRRPRASALPGLAAAAASLTTALWLGGLGTAGLDAGWVGAAGAAASAAFVWAATLPRPR
jgi:Na+/proline symporter